MYAPVAQLGRGTALKTLKVWVRVSPGVSAEYCFRGMLTYPNLAEGHGSELCQYGFKSHREYARVPQPGRGSRLRTGTVWVRIPSRVRHSGAIYGNRTTNVRLQEGALKMRDLRVQVLPVLLETCRRRR